MRVADGQGYEALETTPAATRATTPATSAIT